MNLMYIATNTFRSSRGTLFLKGEEISNLRHMLLPRRDKEMFVKKGPGIEKLEPKAHPSPPRERKLNNPSYAHYGYGPEPGYVSEAVPTSHYIAHDDHDSCSPSHQNFDFGGGDTGGAGASGSWSSGDSGSSYSDSGSCDSGGGDCGGGCDGGGGD